MPHLGHLIIDALEFLLVKGKAIQLNDEKLYLRGFCTDTHLDLSFKWPEENAWVTYTARPGKEIDCQIGEASS